MAHIIPIPVRFTALRPGAEAPRRATPGASGYDLVFLPDNGAEYVEIPEGGVRVLRTGIAIELPEGYEAQVRPRSGTLTTYGYTAILGTVDADYRGEVLVTVHVIMGRPRIRSGDRIAQLVVAPVQAVEWVRADSLSPTERGAGGFGSTGR